MCQSIVGQEGGNEDDVKSCNCSLADCSCDICRNNRTNAGRSGVKENALRRIGSIMITDKKSNNEFGNNIWEKLLEVLLRILKSFE